MNLGVAEKIMVTTETATQKRFSYGLDEISTLTGLSTAFLRKLARAGTLKTKKFGARRLVLEEDLQEFLKGENDAQK